MCIGADPATGGGGEKHEIFWAVTIFFTGGGHGHLDPQGSTTGAVCKNHHVMIPLRNLARPTTTQRKVIQLFVEGLHCHRMR